MCTYANRQVQREHSQIPLGNLLLLESHLYLICNKPKAGLGQVSIKIYSVCKHHLCETIRLTVHAAETVLAVLCTCAGSI